MPTHTIRRSRDNSRSRPSAGRRSRLTVALGLTLGLVASMAVDATTQAAPSPTTENLSAVCAVSPALTPPSVIHAGVRGAVAGESLEFTQTVALEEGTLFQNALSLADGSISISSYFEFSALASPLVVDADSITLTLGGIDLAPLAGTGPTPTAWTLETDTTSIAGRTTWRAYPPADVAAILAANTGVGVPSVTIPAGGQNLVMSYTATVPDSGYAVGDVLDGAECYATVSTGPTNRETDRNTSSVAIVEPDVQLTKNVIGLPVSAADGIVTYRFTAQTPIVNATTDIGVAPSRDVVTIDTVPTGLTPVDQDGNTLGDGDAVPMTGTPAVSGVWNSTDRTITTSLGDIDPGVTRSYEYRAKVGSSVAPGTVLTNTLDADFSSLAGTGQPGDKDFSAPQVTADVTIAAQVPEVTKSSDITKYAPGQPITYTVQATLPAGSSYSNLTLIDTLPDGLTFLSYQTTNCSGSTDCPGTIQSLTTTTNTLGETIIGWYPNNIAASPTPIVITVTYTAQISARYRNNTIVDFLDEFTNKVALKWNNIDRFGSVIANTAAPAEYDGTVDDINTVVRDHPVVLLDKKGYVPNGGVADRGTYGWNYVDGELVTYKTVLRNTGTQPAANLTIDDVHTQLTIDPSTVLIDGAPCASCTITEPATGQLRIVWPGPLAVGDTATLEYVGAPAGTDLRNRITVTTYEDADGSVYREAPTDAVRIVIPDPIVGITKTIVGSANVSNFAGTTIPFRIRVTNTGSMTAHNLSVTDAAPIHTCTTNVVRNASRTVTATGNGAWTIPGELAPGAYVTFDTDIIVCGPIALGTKTNTATVLWEDLDDNRNSAGAIYTASNSANFNVRQPELSVVKGPEIEDGATVPVDAIPTDTDYFTGQWTIAVTNDGTVAAENLTITDPMPESLEYVPGTATATFDPAPAGTLTDNSAVPVPVDPTLVYTDTTTTFTGVISRLEPGQTITILVPFRQNGEQPDELRRDNTATVSNTNLADSPELSDTGAYFLIPAEPTPTVDKTVSSGPAGASPGAEIVTTGVRAEVRYTLDVKLPRDLTLPPENEGIRDLVLRDVLPDGMELTNVPAPGPLPAAGPWSVTCVSGPCASSEFLGDYVGAQSASYKPGATELFFYFGDYNDTTDAIVRITFTAKSKTAFDDGTPVVDGIRDPLVNKANLKWNRHEIRGAGANGDVILGAPTMPDMNGDFDISGRADDAKIDISSPRLDPRKDLFEDAARTIGRSEFEAGDTIYYRIVMTNSGAGSAYNVEFVDDLGNDAGVNRMVVNAASINVVSPVGATCALDGGSPERMTCNYVGPLAADPDGPGGADGGQIVVEYDATPLPSSDILSPTSFDPWEPDTIRNTVSAIDYTEVLNPGPLDNHFTAGQSVTRATVHTPVPNVEIAWIVNATLACPASVGAGRNALLQVDYTNGDKYTRNSNGSVTGLVYGFQNWPEEDLDGNSVLDKGHLYNPTFSVTIPASASYDPNVNTVTASGPDAPTPSDNFSVYTAIAAPDSVTVNSNGTTTLVWNSLVPSLRPNPNASLPAPSLRLRIGLTTAGAGSAWATGNLIGEDGSGAGVRGENVDARFPYSGSDVNRCIPPSTGGGGGGGGGSSSQPPDHGVSKTPDVANNVTVIPGEVFDFSIRWTQSRTAPLTGVSFHDDLPSGLTYAGSLDPSDPGYAVATISPLPTGWTSLEDYYTDTIPTTAGRTRARWTNGMPDLPKGTYTITFPTVAAIPALHPDEFVTNRATLNADQGNRFDDGAVKTVASTKPTITKRVDRPTAPFSTDTNPQYFTFTSDITLPAAYRGFDLIVTDFPNISDGPGFTYGIFNNDYDRVPLQVVPGTDTVTCIAGCTGAVDTLGGTRLGDAPFTNWDKVVDPTTGVPNYANNTTIWPDHHYDFRGPWNAMTGWYIGDVDPDPEGQDRILRFTYQIKAPTVEELYDLTVARRSGWDDYTPILSNPAYVKALSSFEYTNYVQLSMQNANRNWDVNTFNPDWTAGYNPLELTHGGSRTWINATANFKVEYPVLEIEKQCGSADGTTDRDVPNTPAFTPNTRCEITVTNIADVSAFDVVLTEDPGDIDEFFQGYMSQADGRIINRSGTAMTGTARAIPGNKYVGAVERPTYEENSALLTSQQPMLEDAEWNFDLNAGESKTFSYKLRLDGFTNMPAQWFDKDNQASDVGVWDNLASVDSFSAIEGGSPVFETPITAADGVTFTRTYIGVSKFPAQPGRTTDDLRPFNVTSTQFATTAMSNGGHYNWWGHANAYGNNYGGGWFDQPTVAGEIPSNYVDDPLTPYALRRTDMDDIWNSRGVVFMRQVDEECGTLGWDRCGIYRDGNQSNPDRSDLWNLNLDNPDNWAPSLIAHPTEDYRWGIDVRVDGLKNLDTISIADRLPFGWTYKPGSAELIEADWNVGFSGQTDTNPDHDPTTADSVARVAIPDPVIDNTTASSVCNPANYGETGPTITWNFDKAGTTPDPWDTLYLDAGTWSRLANHEGTGGTTSGFAYSSGNAQYEAGAGSFDRYNWVRLEFTAVPDGSVVTCDPDTVNNIEPFFQENNTTVTAGSRVADSPVLSSTYNMIVPVSNPVTLTKTPDAAYTSDDKIVDFEITFTNNLDVPVLDQDFTDTLVLSGINKALPNPPNPLNPPGTFLDPSNHTCGTSTADKAFTETRCDVTQPSATSTAYAITWNVPRIEPGESITFTVPVAVAFEENNAASIDNRVTTIVDEYHDQVLTDIGDYTVVNASPPPNPVKTVTPSPATINDTVTYTIRWVAGSSQAFNDLLYTDVMPDGLELVSLGNVTCSGGCPKNPATVVKMTPEALPDGTTQLGWWFGDMAGTRSASTWQMTYTAKVLGNYKADGSRVESPSSFVNLVQGASNKNNTLDQPPGDIPVGDELDTWFYPGAERTATLLIREPNIVVSKTATTANNPARSGELITYTVTARNTGQITAYGVNMVDTPDVRSLKDIVMAPRTSAAPVGSVAVNGWTLLDPQIGWYIPQIVPNGTATFTYTAVVTDNYLEAGVTEAYNDADVTAFRARPGVNPAPGDRLYTDVPNAETATPLGAPNLRTEKYVGGCTDETLGVDRFAGVAWCVTITNDGTVSATDVVLRDRLPIGWTYRSGSTTGGNWVVTEPSLSLGGPSQLIEWTIDDIAPGDTARVEFVATSGSRAPLDAANYATAVATLADGSPAPLGAPGYRSTDRADVSLRPFGLEIEKTPKEQTRAQPAGSISWDLSVRNPGAAALTDVEVRDLLPAPLTYADSTSPDPDWSFVAAAAAGSGPGGTQPVTFAITRLEPYETVVITVDVSVPATGISEMGWYQNEIQATAAEVADPVVNTAKVRFFTGASVGDRVWSDTDADGVQDDGETGVSNVTVHLLNGDGEQLYRDPVTGVFSIDPADGFPPLTVQTDADGEYLFDGLPAGDYQVQFDPPVGLTLTFPNRGGDVDTDSDADRTTGRTPTFSLAAGDAVRNVDAGLIEGNNSIGDRVWIDVDGDGIQDLDVAEAGLPGVTVTLYNADTGEALQSVVTDGMGNYLFDKLPDGRYEVGFELDPGNLAHQNLAPTWPGRGGDSSLDSNVDRATGRSGVIDLDSAGTSTDPIIDDTIDAGYSLTATLGDRVWNDADGDGVQGPDEVGIAGVIVELRDLDGNVLDTRTTGPDGEYLFADIPVGDYQVFFTRPSGFQPTPQGGGDSTTDSDADVVTGLSSQITLTAGEENLTIDAGFYEPVSIGGPIWDDLDNDGIQEAGEPPIPGVTVRLLDENGDPILDDLGAPITTVTGPDGRFRFDDLPPGQYRTAPVPPAGFVFTKTEQGTDPDKDSNGPEATSQRLLGGESDLTLGAGFYRPVSVGGPIWEDANGDGIQQIDEPTFSGIEVTLLNNDGTPVLDEFDNPVTTLTGADGRFLFAGLPPGQYRTTHGPIPGFLQTTSFQGTDPNLDSNGRAAQSRDLASGDADLTLGSGWVRPVTIGGPIWEDLDADGIIDAGEPPIPGVTVALLDDTGEPILDSLGNPITTVTGLDGRFQFTNLPPGQYQTAPVPPAGLVWTKTEQGTNRAIDSNGPTATSADLAPGGSDLTLGGGFVRPVTIGGPIWEDLDGDGIIDAGEPPIPGVTVRLLHADGTPVLDDDGNPITTVTGADGRFEFANLPPGQYLTVPVPPEGYIWTRTGQGTNRGTDSNGPTATSADLAPGGSDLTLGGGFVRPVTIGGPIWEDLDGDGVFAQGEPPIPGVTVRLLDADGTPVLDDDGNPITTVTGPDGRFEFTNLLPGTYLTVPVPPDGFLWTQTGQGPDRAVDSNGPTATSDDVESGGSDLTLGGGFYRPVTVGGWVWEDIDKSGVKNELSPPIPGVTVTLLDENGDPVRNPDGTPKTTTTDADGSYVFTDLPPGVYQVLIPVPPGFIGSPKIVPTGDQIGTVRDESGTTEPHLATSGTTDMDHNAGFRRPNGLPRTGGDPFGPVRNGLVLALLGAALVVGSRRRSRAGALTVRVVPN